jgi:tetratricopeptide (TPR) repeat protein
MPSSFFRIGIVTLCAFLCAIAVAYPALSAQTAGTSSSAPTPGTFLVFPFENQSRMANLDWVGEGLAEITSERLEDRGLSVFSREERLAVLEKIGLPDSARFSHATMVKIAGEADADEIIYGRFVSDGKTVTVEAQVLHLNPPRLSEAFTQTTSMDDLLRAHARLSWQLLCVITKRDCPFEGANRDESSFSEPPPSLHMDALENFVHGLTGTDDEARLRALREAARLEPAWDRPAYELGLIYFGRRDCESALPWFSRVPPNRPDGPEASFDTGVCHLLRNDPARAEASFSGLMERARSSDPKDQLPEMAEVHNNLGIARLHLGNSIEAAAEFERATALDADEPDYWINLGIARLAAKQAAAAVTPFERARNLAPDDKDARVLLISTLESVGRASDAAAILAANPGDPPQGAGHAAQAVPQDPVALMHMARMSKEFDRSLLRSAGDDPGLPSGKAARSSGDGGEHK